ncbi:MAG: type VI secretion system protein TssA [Planctomycetaceae bacterium]|nr:type VI secretion system protein TssA [Planctomycetaceae bacterium]
MTIPNTVWNSIADPVSADLPCGHDLRQSDDSSKLLFHIRHLRHQATTEERQALLQETDHAAWVKMWQELLTEISAVLGRQSKDLELLTYLLEAALRLDGFRGLYQALEYVTTLISEHWPALHPCSETDDDELRLRHLNGLNGLHGDGTLLPVIVTTPLLPATDCPSITLGRYLRAQDAGTSNNKRAEPNDQLPVLKADAASVRPETVQESRQAIGRAIRAFDSLDEQLTLHCDAAFFSSAIRNRLRNCEEALTYICGPAPLPAQEAAVVDENQHDGATGDSPMGPEADHDTLDASQATDQPVPGSNSVLSRQQAMKSLGEVATYFERSEPHSPIGYAVRQLIGWGSMELPQLMEHLIPDEHARDTFFLLSGIRGRQDAE